jgi:hypothetical protein
MLNYQRVNPRVHDGQIQKSVQSGTTRPVLPVLQFFQRVGLSSAAWSWSITRLTCSDLSRMRHTRWNGFINWCINLETYKPRFSLNKPSDLEAASNRSNGQQISKYLRMLLRLRCEWTIQFGGPDFGNKHPMFNENIQFLGFIATSSGWIFSTMDPSFRPKQRKSPVVPRWVLSFGWLKV